MTRLEVLLTGLLAVLLAALAVAVWGAFDGPPFVSF